MWSGTRDEITERVSLKVIPSHHRQLVPFASMLHWTRQRLPSTQWRKKIFTSSVTTPPRGGHFLHFNLCFPWSYRGPRYSDVPSTVTGSHAPSGQHASHGQGGASCPLCCCALCVSTLCESVRAVLLENKRHHPLVSLSALRQLLQLHPAASTCETAPGLRFYLQHDLGLF
jgi:hypothetical protein